MKLSAWITTSILLISFSLSASSDPQIGAAIPKTPTEGATQISGNRPIQSVTSVTQHGKAVDITAQTTTGALVELRITCPATASWRLQTPVKGAYNNLGAGQQLAKEFDNKSPKDPKPVTLQSNGKDWQVTSPKSGSVQITADACLIFHSENGETTVRIDSLSLGEKTSSLETVLDSNERLFGTGERFNQINQRGKSVEIWAIDKYMNTEGNSYVPIPFIMSTRKYALFMNRFEHQVIDLGAAKPDRLRMEINNAPVDLYVFLNPSPTAQLTQLTKLTGPSPIPAPWSFGIHICRYGEFRDPAAVRETMRQMTAHNLPWDSIIMEGWDAYDPTTYPELKKLADELHASGKKMLMYQATGRLAIGGTRLFRHPSQILKDEYLVHDDKGATVLEEADSYNPADHATRSAEFLDITNPAAVDWWLQKVWNPLVLDINVDGAKIDFCEQFPEHEPLKLFDGRPTPGTHNWYATAYNIHMYRCYQQRPEGGMNFSRGGSIGAQRYPFIWDGDHRRQWSALPVTIRAALSSGLSGIPYMCHDLAGYRPAKLPAENDEAKVFIRGAQIACFTATMQTHGLVTRPYDFDPATVDIYRIYSNLHQSLRPYMCLQAKAATQYGLPLTRHLFLADPNDTTAYDIEDEYLFGFDLLVAPVVTDTDKRDIYIPSGKWYDVYTGRMHEGRRWLRDYHTPLNRIPVFVREKHSSTLKKPLEILKSIP